MRVAVTSIMVDDQRKALEFYTHTLGFQVKHDMPMGEDSWLTIVPHHDPDGVQILLEPSRFEPAKAYRKALYDANIPAAMLHVDNLQWEYERLQALGVEFVVEPTSMDTSIMAVIDDTCGNKLVLVQQIAG